MGWGGGGVGDWWATGLCGVAGGGAVGGLAGRSDARAVRRCGGAAVRARGPRGLEQAVGRPVSVMGADHAGRPWAGRSA